MAQPAAPGAYPLPAFHFSVDLMAGPKNLPKAEPDGCFQEVSGLQAERTFEEVEEGGENRFLHRLPGRVKYSHLILKRGIVAKGTALSDWFDLWLADTLAKPLAPANLTVSLLGSQNQPVIAWWIVNAFPVKWEASSMQSEENKVMTETLELSYNYFKRINLGQVTTMADAMKVMKQRMS